MLAGFDAVQKIADLQKKLTGSPDDASVYLEQHALYLEILKDDKKAKPPAAPAAGSTSLPFEVDQSAQASAESLVALYHSSERGAGGYFPLADSTTFHCGAHFRVDHRTKVRAIARSEVVAARLSVEPGEHPWGDTGFVVLRHPLDGGKALYSLLLHLEREPLHPDRASGWLKYQPLTEAAGYMAKLSVRRIPVALSTCSSSQRVPFSVWSGQAG